MSEQWQYTLNVLTVIAAITSVASLGASLGIYFDSTREMRIQGFVTRYITLRTTLDGRLTDPVGMHTMISAGALWLRNNEELKSAVRRIADSGVTQPFNADQFDCDLLDFCKYVFHEKRHLLELNSIFEFVVRARERGMKI